MNSEQSTLLDTAYAGRVRYNETNAERYQQRNPRRHRAEMKLIARVFRNIPRGSVLDIPSGGGRVGVSLAREGYRVTCADYSQAMVDITRRNASHEALSIPVDRQDIERMTYADGAFDAVVCFRLFHHFPDREIRQRVVREMCRVARDRVAVSYFSPYAYSSLRRKVRSWLSGRQHKFATSLDEVSGYFENCGFQFEQDYGQLPYVHTLHVGVFKRASDA